MSQAEIVLDIQQKGIIVRDFAYETTLPRVLEFFDLYKALAEYDYCLLQCPRTVPISGKVLSRLLDIGWVGYREARDKWHLMDWEALDIYETRPHPWFTAPSVLPSREQRIVHCTAYSRHFNLLKWAAAKARQIRVQFRSCNAPRYQNSLQQIQINHRGSSSTEFQVTAFLKTIISHTPSSFNPIMIPHMVIR
jgi:hypothetical protein